MNIIGKVFKSQKGRVWLSFVLILILSVFALFVDAGSYYNRGVGSLSLKTGNKINLPRVKEVDFSLGLDLLGGTHLVYTADVKDVPVKDRATAVEGVRDVIERRVNVFGVSEPLVQVNQSGGEYRVIVELAGIKDVSEAIKMIGETPLLEFKEENKEIRQLTEEERGEMEDYNKKAEGAAEKILGKTISGGDFFALAKEFSEDEKTKENGGDLGWISKENNNEISEAVKELAVGRVANELVKTKEGFEIIKLEEKRAKKDPFSEVDSKEVKASHLLICYDGVANCVSGLSKEDAFGKIKELKEKATVYNFGQLVKENSTEPGAAERVGDLGWFGRGAMVKPFEDAVFSQAIGMISDPVETEFGYHLIYKQDERVVEEFRASHILVRTISEDDIIGPQDEWKNTELTGKYLKRAVVEFNPNGNAPEVALEFDSEGSQLFEDITARNVGKLVAVFLDGYPISIPRVNEKISGGKAVISGNFNIKEAKLLAQRINAGSLPVPISLVSQQTVGASLGQKAVDSSLWAGIIGFALVALFMILFYRLPGVIAVVSLGIYGLLLLAVFKLWPVTLTLAGMAGFIMSIGMAVDANILIFARTKEELRAGKPLRLSLEEGFRRAWPSIRDSNISTLITCFILAEFSTSIVKGFANTLALGVVVSMFTAILVTRNLLNLFLGSWAGKRAWLISGGLKKS